LHDHGRGSPERGLVAAANSRRAFGHQAPRATPPPSAIGPGGQGYQPRGRMALVGKKHDPDVRKKTDRNMAFGFARTIRTWPNPGGFDAAEHDVFLALRPVETHLPPLRHVRRMQRPGTMVQVRGPDDRTCRRNSNFNPAAFLARPGDRGQAWANFAGAIGRSKRVNHLPSFERLIVGAAQRFESPPLEHNQVVSFEQRHYSSSEIGREERDIRDGAAPPMDSPSRMAAYEAETEKR